MMVKVLVTGAGALLGQGIIKSLRLADNDYYIVAVDPDPRSIGLYWADKACLVPMATELNYLENVCQIIKRENPDVILIGTDVELMIFAENKEKIELDFDTKVVVSSPEAIKIADDKWLTYNFLRENGFPFPKSVLLGDKKINFPLIVKPRVGARSVGVHRVKTLQELDYALSVVDNPIIQEDVSTPDNEYTSGIVVFDGIAKAIVTMRRDLRDGNTFRAYIEPESPFDSILMEMAEKLGGTGPLNFQFRNDGGVPKVFEINARFSGTTPIRALAGFNEVDQVVQHVVRGYEVVQNTIRSTTVLRYWDEQVVDMDTEGINARRITHAD